MKNVSIILAISLFSQLIMAQGAYWQQKADYQIDFSLNVDDHSFSGTESITYSNNSPDTLSRAFIHLYFNAFQPGSMMDVRSRAISDPDRRIGSRISKLQDKEQGKYHILSLKQDGKKLAYHMSGTVLELKLAKPLLPGQSTVLDLAFKGQVPVQIRRSGRDNAEGIAYSMAQWFPKMAEYDYRGWHADPYVAREFYAPWGSFDVKITLDSSYTVAASGYLQNPKEVGHGYLAKDKKPLTKNGSLNTWHFKAPDVHDFVWAADPNWVHEQHQVQDGPMLHLFYVPGKKTKSWKKLPGYFEKGIQYLSRHFGKYPYQQYSVIQAGDGGMEYPMATLITGNRRLGSLVGVTMHELAHSWYQMVLATNEARGAWMDEGFTTYASNRAFNAIMHPDSTFINPVEGSYHSYFNIVNAGLEEPLTTHADHFATNKAYSMAAYSKGSIFLHQLSYIIGTESFDKGMLRYFREWKFKHPTDVDFIRIMEKESGLELDWYLDAWAYSTQTIDYSIERVEQKGRKLSVSLEKLGQMPMPLDVLVSYDDGSTELHYIPLGIMRGEKPADKRWDRWVQHSDWFWTHPAYELDIQVPAKKKVVSVSIDPLGSIADVDRANNKVEIEPESSFLFKRR